MCGVCASPAPSDASDAGASDLLASVAPLRGLQGDPAEVCMPGLTGKFCRLCANWSAPGPHRVHSHTVHLPLGALLMTCTMCGTGGPPASPSEAAPAP